METDEIKRLKNLDFYFIRELNGHGVYEKVYAKNLAYSKNTKADQGILHTILCKTREIE